MCAPTSSTGARRQPVGSGDLASVADRSRRPGRGSCLPRSWTWRSGRPSPRLPDDLRTTLHLVVVQGLTHQEAAEVLGCPRNTISWRMFRARELLRKQLVPLLGDGEEKEQ